MFTQVSRWLKSIGHEKALKISKRYLYTDLALKCLFMAYFPSLATLSGGALLCVPSVCALYGIQKRRPKWLLPASVLHALVYMVPLLLLGSGYCFILVAYGGAYVWNLPENEPGRACNTWINYNKELQPELRTRCEFDTEYNPFWYKNLHEPDYQDGCPKRPTWDKPPGFPTGIASSSCGATYSPHLNAYQQTLTAILIAVALFGIVGWQHIHLVQLMRKMHAEIETKSLGTLLTSAEAVN